MITVVCLACGIQTNYAGLVKDMVDVTCPRCSLRSRIVVTPMNLEPPDEVSSIGQSDASERGHVSSARDA